MIQFLAKMPVGVWALIIFPLTLFTGYGASTFFERLFSYPSLTHMPLSTATALAAFWLMCKGAEAIKKSRSNVQNSN